MSTIIINESGDDWTEIVCEETFFVTLSGTWSDAQKKIWQTPEGEYYQIDRNNFATEYKKNSNGSNKRPSLDEDDDDDLKGQNGSKNNSIEEIGSNPKKCKNI
jgi:hypothetical protein